MAPRKRRVLLLGLAGCLAALACLIFLVRDRSAINHANYEKIQVGMPLAEVEAILGGPARDESTGPIESDSFEKGADFAMQVELFRRNVDWRHVPLWKSDRLMIGLEVDEQGRVAGKVRLEVRRVQQSFWQRVRRWLRV